MSIWSIGILVAVFGIQIAYFELISDLTWFCASWSSASFVAIKLDRFSEPKMLQGDQFQKLLYDLFCVWHGVKRHYDPPTQDTEEQRVQKARKLFE